MITMVLYKIKAYNAQLVNVFHSVKYSITLRTQLKPFINNSILS